MSGNKIYQGCYVAMALWFARKLVDKLGLNTGRLCVVLDYPGEPYILVGMARRDVKNGEHGRHAMTISEDELVASKRDTITLCEAAYINPEKYGATVKIQTFQNNRKDVGAAIARIRKRKGMVHK
jgi:hypothetical protein